jgi:hypothetical protein
MSGENCQPSCTWHGRQSPTIGIFVVPRIVAARRDDEQPIVGQGGNRPIELLRWVVSRGNADKAFQLLVGRLPIPMSVCVVAALGLHSCLPGVAVDFRFDHVTLKTMPVDRRDRHRRTNGLANSSSSLIVRWTNQTEIIAGCGSGSAAARGRSVIRCLRVLRCQGTARALVLTPPD